METKLTLKIKQQVIRQAKKYAQKRKTSLSKLVENYLQKISNTKGDQDDHPITPLVKSLSGVLKETELGNQDSYTEFLQKKYQ